MKIVFISGPTGSGKTTLSNVISKKFKNSFVLSTDNYYKTGFISRLLSKLIEDYFDKIISFDYKLFEKDFNLISKNLTAEHKYLYDFQNKTISKFLIKKKKVKVLIVEGIFAKDLLYKFDKVKYILIEIKTDKLSCMNRTIKRDANERGKSNDVAKIDFLKSWKYFYNKNKFTKKTLNEFIYSNNTDLNLVFEKIINL